MRVYGSELVFDLYDFEMAQFVYKSTSAQALDIGGSATAYSGWVTGWSNYTLQDRGIQNYSGPSLWGGGSVNLPFKIIAYSFQVFGTPDGKLTGWVEGPGLGVSLSPLPGSAYTGTSYYGLVKAPPPFRSKIYPTLSDGTRFWNAINVALSDLGLVKPAQKQAMQNLVMENAHRWVRWKGRKD